MGLSGCLISEEGCASLTSALTFNPFHLKKLDLSYNHPGDSAVRLLIAGVKDSRWRLEALRSYRRKLSFSASDRSLNQNSSARLEDRNGFLWLFYSRGGKLQSSDQLSWVEPAGVRFLTLCPWRYSCQLTIDSNTVSRRLKVSEDNRKVTWVKELQSYPDHPNRFDVPQLLCRTYLTGRCYWEVKWSGRVDISVSSRGITRRGNGWFGENNKSWTLSCSDNGYSAWHNNRKTSIHSSVSDRVAVYVDCHAGILSFYRVSSDSLIHLHTFNITFTEPLLPGFWLGSGSSVFLY
ncbi:neoverrucotoxin subunit alpha-like [Gambusia affinis]|uniref:neoverrucotoxin subunit alpha-like n=1 Tax=Gambusia affinis TaxID=33528 RepID=UPI001CDB8CDB|nr:neoverrucotoxin subunit alpha-like [Gambusia affinis]